MTFQISAISIYGEDGRIRTVELHAGKLNIITGDSRRGKSALLNIVDFCMASTDYVIKGEVLRDRVAVFAITLVKDGQQLFVARPAPAHGKSTASTMCVQAQALGAPPLAHASIAFTTPVDTAKSLISDFAGIDSTIRLAVARMAAPIPVTVRHALFFCLQKQNEIANQDVLFHSQGEEYRPNTIRAVLPYFLGAIDPEQAELEHQLQQLRRELAAMEKALAATRVTAPASGRALALRAEAVEAGLLPATGASEPDAIMTELRRALDVVPERDAAPDGDPVGELFEDRRRLRELRARRRAQIATLKRTAKENDDFLTQATEQHTRLTSLGLLGDGAASDQLARCPVCDSETSQQPAVVESIRRDLARLDADMTVLGISTPEINALAREEELALEEIRGQLAQNQEQIDTLTAGQRIARQQADAHRHAALVQGRISLFLETAARAEPEVRVVDRREELVGKISQVEERLGVVAHRERLTSFLSLINAEIKSKAEALNLEHSEWPIRLDPRALSVAADTRNGSVFLSDMGSGQNWMGYHVATMLSLHEWFAEQDCPVPGLLILDQPSQVYYPEDASEGADLTGADRVALLNLYRVIQASVERLCGSLQVIVMEHADLDEEPFRSAVRERWRESNGNALVPLDWPVRGTSES